MNEQKTNESILTRLKEISNNNFELPSNIDAFNLIKEVCKCLGSADPVLRDDLGYTLLAEWIYKKKFLNDEQLRELLGLINSDSMWFYRIGENQTESVFMRSFSSLVITLLLLVDKDNRFLTYNEWKDLLENTLDYCSEEKDLRGYDENSGWIHTAAHVADVLNALVKHPNFSREYSNSILLSIKKVMDTAEDVFQYEEDERLARVISNLVDNNFLTVEEISLWFRQVKLEKEPYILAMRKRVNWKLLYRSCFSQLVDRKQLTSIVGQSIIEVKNKFDAWYL